MNRSRAPTAWHRTTRCALILLIALTACGDEADEPSQGADAAARDGVLAELAALPLDARMSIQAEVATGEGIWVVSRPGLGAEEAADGCRLGLEGGKYPSEMICTVEYGELLLLDDSRAHVLQAFPLPALPPDLLAVTPDAVYCARRGDGPLPDSMLCRIDRATLVMTVRVFPSELESIVVQPCFYPPANWHIDDRYLDVQDLVSDEGGRIWVREAGGWMQLDPETLTLTSAASGPTLGT